MKDSSSDPAVYMNQTALPLAPNNILYSGSSSHLKFLPLAPGLANLNLFKGWLKACPFQDTSPVIRPIVFAVCPLGAPRLSQLCLASLYHPPYLSPPNQNIGTLKTGVLYFHVTQPSPGLGL